MGKVRGKVVVREIPWKVRMEHGKRNSRRWKREVWELKVVQDFVHWCGLCWANVELSHIIETQALDGGRVSRQVKPLWGTQHTNEYDRHDIEVKVPGHGQTYLHILCWFYFYNQGEYKTWKDFRLNCKRKGLDVDHGRDGFAQRHRDGWRCYTDVHTLSLEARGSNRAQGAACRQKYQLEEQKFQKKQKLK